ncbi:hypothetical protein CIPAW_11G016700 [Carya illinoinensis]|uniref:Uncharacterized protein n=1 Tax=Carya illinoinensis TaxID=32201 RepID=A0A8T1NTY2_CARIL|nr:hypothetical protein CIPAW_11G016700 [Carya illinoinensis]
MLVSLVLSVFLCPEIDIFSRNTQCAATSFHSRTLFL